MEIQNLCIKKEWITILFLSMDNKKSKEKYSVKPYTKAQVDLGKNLGGLKSEGEKQF